MNNESPKNLNQSKNVLSNIGKIIRRFDILLVILVVLLLFIYPKLWQNLLVIGDFMPHGVCYFWIPELVALHLISDSIIGLSYVAISVTLGVLVFKARKDIPFQKAFVAFGMFIIACGMTHFMEIWTTFYASYWLSGYVKLVTAVVSAATAILLPFLIPKIILLIQRGKSSNKQKQELKELNTILEKEIAERKRIENDLLLRQIWLNEAQALSSVGSWEWDVIQDKYKWTDQLYRLFGLDMQKFVPSTDNVSDFIHPEDKEKVLKEIRETLDKKTTTEQEFRIINSNEEILYVHSRRKVVLNEQNEVVKIIGTIQDITKRKKDFDTIYQLNKEIGKRTTQLEASNKELEAFSYSVSHDLRAPLRAIDGFSSILLEDFGDVIDDDGKKYINNIKSATKNMGLLIEDLLKLSRITRSEMEMETVNLSSLANQIINTLKFQDAERDVFVEIEPGLEIKGDQGLLQIVLENLISNAWKFTSKKPKAEIIFGKQIKDNKTVFFLRDNGAGFNMKYKENLFVPFQRLHNKKDFEGIGIGLAIVQRIINRHGGEIWAEADTDKGSVFYFTI